MFYYLIHRKKTKSVVLKFTLIFSEHQALIGLHLSPLKRCMSIPQSLAFIPIKKSKMALL